MNRFWLIFVLISICFSCSTSRNTTSSSDQKTDYATSQKDSILITVKSGNLSEDMTHNDELLFMGYLTKSSGTLDSAVLRKRLTLDSQNMTKSFQWHVDQSVLGQDLMLFILEQDSDTPIEQIDAILRIHYKPIVNAFKNRSYSEIEKYIGDEDILDCRVLNILTPTEFNFRGVYKMDRYDYSVKIEKTRHNIN